VNYVLRTGLHSYATGAGGQFEVAIVVALNWIFVAVAGFRYFFETYVPPAPAPAGR
jgi:hypothetical protein